MTSRIRFLSRGDREVSPVEVTISLPQASALTWAHAIPLGDKPYRAEIRGQEGQALLRLPQHSAATMLVVGSGTEPALEDGDTARLVRVRDTRFPARARPTPTAAPAPIGTVTNARLRLTGTSFYHPGPFRVFVDGVSVGTLEGSYGSFPCTVKDLATPEVTLLAADEGAWFLPDYAELSVETTAGMTATAIWEPGDDPRSFLPSPSLPAHASHPSQEAAAAPQATTVSPPGAELRAGGALRALVLPLRWSLKRPPPATVAWKGMDRACGGAWPGAYGSLAAWVAGASSAKAQLQNGFRLGLLQGGSFVWARTSDDPRAPLRSGADGKKRVAACWFHPVEVICEITPDDNQPYCLTLHVLDYDRAARSLEISLTDPFGEKLDVRAVSVPDMANGCYLTWSVTGPARAQIRYTGANPNANAVLSAVFIDQ